MAGYHDEVIEHPANSPSIRRSCSPTLKLALATLLAAALAMPAAAQTQPSPTQQQAAAVGADSYAK